MRSRPNGIFGKDTWIWDAACSIRGAKDAPKYKEFILPLIFAKRLCDVFDDELNRIAREVGSRAKAFTLVKHDKKLVRFYLPLEPKNPNDLTWSVIRTLSDKIGEQPVVKPHAKAKTVQNCSCERAVAHNPNARVFCRLGDRGVARRTDLFRCLKASVRGFTESALI
jgi:hypothetical protein